MSFGASSCVDDLTDALYTLVDRETSFARLYETDSSNTSAVPWKDTMRALLRNVKELGHVTASTAELNLMDGVTATTAELNALDGVEGYAIGHVASSARQVATSTFATTGGSMTWATGLTSILTLEVLPIRVTATPGTAWACVTATWTGGTVTVDQWKPTSGTNTLLVRAAGTERTYSAVAVGT